MPFWSAGNVIWVFLTLALLVTTLIAILVAYVSGHTEDAKFFVQAFSGTGVILAVLTALYRDAITNLVDRIQLHLELPEQPDNFHNLKSTPAGAVRVLCHHLRVVNEKPHRPVRNCRVWLVRIFDEVAEGKFEERFKFAVPRLMPWAPNEFSPEVRSFAEDQVFDFGQSVVDFGRFEVTYHERQRGVFKGDCEVGKTRRYVFKIAADNYVRSESFTVEVRVSKVEPTDDWPYKMKADVKIFS